MKKFIYLDNNTLNSLVSQINKGIITNTTQEKSAQSSKKRGNKGQINGEGIANLKIFKKGFEAKVEGAINSEQEKSNSTVLKYITNKASYDEVFEEFLAYIETNKLLKDISKFEKIGDFIKINTNMSIVDLNYYLKLLSPGSFLDTIIDQEIDTSVKEIVEKEEEEEKPNSKQLSYEIEKFKKTAKKQLTKTYQQACKALQALIELIPYNKVIFADNALIMIDDNFFRDNPSIIANKYGGNLEIIGYITNEIIPQKQDASEENILETFPNLVNSLLLDLFKKEKLIIVHPIAIYYN